MKAQLPDSGREQENARPVSGVFLLNTFSWCAAVTRDDGSHGRACAPSKDVSAGHWRTCFEDPLLGDDTVTPCEHAACAVVLQAEK